MARPRKTRKLADYELAGADNITSYAMPGRPPRDPKDKVGIPIRVLVTVGVSNGADAGATKHGIKLSDYLRLALLNQLKADGVVSDTDIAEDNTWEELRKLGVV